MGFGPLVVLLARAQRVKLRVCSPNRYSTARRDDIPQSNEYHASQALSPASSLQLVNQRAACTIDNTTAEKNREAG
jgi:hypothetical protein